MCRECRSSFLCASSSSTARYDVLDQERKEPSAFGDYESAWLRLTLAPPGILGQADLVTSTRLLTRPMDLTHGVLLHKGSVVPSRLHERVAQQMVRLAVPIRSAKPEAAIIVTSRQARLVSRFEPGRCSMAFNQSSVESFACSGPKRTSTAAMNAESSRSAISNWSFETSSLRFEMDGPQMSTVLFDGIFQTSLLRFMRASYPQDALPVNKIH